MVSQRLPAYSIYTWPFRLSLTHASAARNGNYFPDLDGRIERYCERLERGGSLVFFYLNYDNPISADEYKYALVGCARLTDIASGGEFAFDPGELAELRSDPAMKNFPTMNWALRLSHAGPTGSVRLPYHEYLEHIAAHPEQGSKLDEIRVLVDEPSLLPNFKYVSEQVSDDHALQLLYKLKWSFALVQQHGIVDADDSLRLIEEYIADCWASRGLYPGLGSVVNVLADLADGQPEIEGVQGERLVKAVRSLTGPGEDLLDAVFSLLESSAPPSDALAAHRDTIERARDGLTDNQASRRLLRKLALFTLTPRQVGRILFPAASPWGGIAIPRVDLEENPYLLAEAYVPVTLAEKEEKADLDREQRTDGAIDYGVIDIGMFPDRRYLQKRGDLQNLTAAGPERLRAFAIEALRTAQEAGHSFVSTELLVKRAAQHPLFYRETLAVTQDQILSHAHLAHFRLRLQVAECDGVHYFYLQETYDAEQIVRRFVSERLKIPARRANTGWLASLLDQEAADLAAKIDDFDAATFKAERSRLMTGALGEAFYCVTGRPGSGKSQAVGELLTRLQERGERTLVLAPTGKAALRLNQEAPAGAAWEAQTIDRWIYRSGLAAYLGDLRGLATMKRADRYAPVDNVIIDEMSMINLFHLALLFRALEVHQAASIKRVILVGDEHQLPPIGCGKPFQDIVEHLRADEGCDRRNHIRLTTNCRQQHDPTVLEAAHLFAGKNRYHTELFDRLCAGGPISRFLNVRYWSSPTELRGAVEEFVEETLDRAVPDHRTRTRDEAFNLLLNLYENDHVPNYAAGELKLDRVQLLSPYRGGPAGALGLSDFMRATYRPYSLAAPYKQSKGFVHSDKIVRISNDYVRNRATGQKELRLSNGSIGVLCGSRKGWKAFFPESDGPIGWAWMDGDDFELAYALTAHKAQGSEFEEVVVVVPERRALLSRELIYTAMTRSRTRLILLVQKSARANPLSVAQDRSVLAGRNSSIFTAPFDMARLFEPEVGAKVKSKIEYMIYTALMGARDAGRLSFAYEDELELPFEGKRVMVRPDFTIRCGGRTYYWEHLGMLDRGDYARDWRARRRAYQAAGLEQALITTDDLAGVRRDNLSALIDDLAGGQLAGAPDVGFSLHHYRL